MTTDLVSDSNREARLSYCQDLRYGLPKLLMQRQCNDCNKLKDLKFFNKDSWRKLGRAYTCKSCMSIRGKHRTPEQKLKRAELVAKETRKAKAYIYKVLGNKCCKCGFVDERALQLDHINGDGFKDRKKT